MDLVVSPPRERLSAGLRAPFSGGGLLMRTDDGAVDHQIVVVAIGGERFEHAIPDARVAPAAEAATEVARESGQVG